MPIIPRRLHFNTKNKKKSRRGNYVGCEKNGAILKISGEVRRLRKSKRDRYFLSFFFSCTCEGNKRKTCGALRKKKKGRRERGRLSI